MELLKQLVLALPMPAQVWAADGTVLLTNPLFNRLLGYPDDLVWADEDLTFLQDPQVVAQGLEPKLREALTGHAVEIASFDYDPSHSQDAPGKAAGFHRIAISVRPLGVDTRQLSCAVCLITDHGEVGGRLENELMRSQKMENVEALASSVAHEFNNIFTGIRGLSGLIRDSADMNSEIYSFAKEIEDNIIRGAELIRKLSSFAREIPHSLRLMYFSEYLNHALPLLQIQVQRRVSIMTEVLSDGLVLLDSSRMDQALANIIGNARDAMGGHGRLRLRLEASTPAPELLELVEFGAPAGWMMLEIADNGPGIPDEIRERVVQPFFSTKERGKSTGLGLSVTQRIIELHQGLLEVGRSTDMGGAAIRIYLPMAENLVGNVQGPEAALIFPSSADSSAQKA
jgi:signal transduction histidine kinase